MAFDLQLLSLPSRRPIAEAWVWFTDGWKLVKRAPGLWAGASLLVLALYFVAICAAGIVSLVPIALLQLVPLIIAGLCAQAGLIFLAQSVSRGEIPKSKRFISFWQWRENKTFWQLVLLILAIQAGAQVLQNWVVPGELYAINGEHFVLNEAAVLPYALVYLGTQLLVLALSWAAVPLLCDFPHVSFAQLLRLQWQGSVRNIGSLLFFGVLVLLTVAGFLGLISLLTTVSQTLAFTLLMLGAMWYWVLSAAWLFSAYRHIFTTW